MPHRVTARLIASDAGALRPDRLGALIHEHSQIA
jgi:hypothetical protein